MNGLSKREERLRRKTEKQLRKEFEKSHMMAAVHRALCHEFREKYANLYPMPAADSKTTDLLDRIMKGRISRYDQELQEEVETSSPPLGLSSGQPASTTS